MTKTANSGTIRSRTLKVFLCEKGVKMKKNSRKVAAKVFDIIGAIGALFSFILIITLAFGAGYGHRLGLQMSFGNMVISLLVLMVVTIAALKIADKLDPSAYYDSYEYPSEHDRW